MDLDKLKISTSHNNKCLKKDLLKIVIKKVKVYQDQILMIN